MRTSAIRAECFLVSVKGIKGHNLDLTTSVVRMWGLAVSNGPNKVSSNLRDDGDRFQFPKRRCF
jgi:hypothetical protein